MSIFSRRNPMVPVHLAGGADCCSLVVLANSWDKVTALLFNLSKLFVNSVSCENTGSGFSDSLRTCPCIHVPGQTWAWRLPPALATPEVCQRLPVARRCFHPWTGAWESDSCRIGSLSHGELVVMPSVLVIWSIFSLIARRISLYFLYSSRLVIGMSSTLNSTLSTHSGSLNPRYPPVLTDTTCSDSDSYREPVLPRSFSCRGCLQC